MKPFRGRRQALSVDDLPIVQCAVILARGVARNLDRHPGQTVVTVHYEAFEDNVSKSWMVAETNGSVENHILNRIEQEVAAMPPAAFAIPTPVAAAAPTVLGKSAADSLLDLKKLLDAGALTPAE